MDADIVLLPCVLHDTKLSVPYSRMNEDGHHMFTVTGVCHASSIAFAAISLYCCTWYQ